MFSLPSSWNEIFVDWKKRYVRTLKHKPVLSLLWRVAPNLYVGKFGYPKTRPSFSNLFSPQFRQLI
jgi:hypothetical protein